MDCWNFKNCNESKRDCCPAYPYSGMSCWKVTGTKCGNGEVEMATLSEKVSYCRKCDFYKHHAVKY